MPAVLPEIRAGEAPGSYEFHPRPGEKLQLRIRRPAARGRPDIRDRLGQQALQVGKRSTTTTLEADYRSTQGGRHGIGVPKQARVTSVRLDGRPVQVRPVDNELPVELRPGSHAMKVEWIMPAGAGTANAARRRWICARPRATSIPASSCRGSLAVAGIRLWRRPGDRLLGRARRSSSAIAWLLGRWRHSPLRTHEWLLLGFGLSTRSWVVLVLVALWLFAMRWREGWGGSVSRWRFNTRAGGCSRC